ncbi:hypothetical protein FGO68_gene6778 [Halteria grandinella]|uniref:Uncharacterized protein n=1 Tax=Halteria grandinella TaxID=5974 RepID=A0A8J8SZ18_HALGN|nr:hypothetical protein FGO68_gene6778 [Halteria grandinella]
MEPSETKHKILLLGGGSAGKTILLQSYYSEEFQTSHIPTIGIDFKSKKLTVDGNKAYIQLYDTAGCLRFRTVTQSFYNGAAGYIFVFDVTARESFEDIKNFIASVEDKAQLNVCKILVGSKIDLENRLVTYDEAAILASDHGMNYNEVSAKDGTNVKEMFDRFIDEVVRRPQNRDSTIFSLDRQRHTEVKLDGGQKKVQNQESKCC